MATRSVSTSRTPAIRTNSILFNGDFEIAPAVLTDATSTVNRFIDGTAAGSNAIAGYGWATTATSASAEAAFDTANAYSGTYCMRLSTLNTTGAITVSTFKTNTTDNFGQRMFILLPNTTYAVSARIKTNNVATNSAFIEFRQLNSGFGVVSNTTSTRLSGTNAYTLVTMSVTTAATTTMGTVLLRNNVPGNVGDAWFDEVRVVPVISRTIATGRSLV